MLKAQCSTQRGLFVVVEGDPAAVRGHFFATYLSVAVL
jgi:hypothetical protein